LHNYRAYVFELGQFGENISHKAIWRVDGFMPSMDEVNSELLNKI
jgi:hypothetical protein